ncbi:MAG TPA: hypothetical protein VH590_00755 [Ktedonobacterales bacterium]|jgi:hypothetical protein
MLARLPITRTTGVICLLVGALVVGSVLTWTLYLSPTHAASPFFNRHNLPGDIPLPDGVAFVSFHANPPLTAPAEVQVWLWTSSDPPARVQAFYMSQLGAPYWETPQAQQRGPNDLMVSALGTLHFRLLGIEAQAQSAAAAAPPGGCVLTIAFTSGP